MARQMLAHAITRQLTRFAMRKDMLMSFAPRDIRQPNPRSSTRPAQLREQVLRADH